MKKELTAERRSERRLRTAGLVRVRLRTTDDRVMEGHLEDINNAGAFVATLADLKTGTPVQLEIEIPGASETKAIPAIVARRRAEVLHPNAVLAPGLGLKFVARTAEELELIHQTVMTTLTIDLLGHGNRKYKDPLPDDTVAFGRPFYRSDSKS